MNVYQTLTKIIETASRIMLLAMKNKWINRSIGTECELKSILESLRALEQELIEENVERMG